MGLQDEKNRLCIKNTNTKSYNTIKIEYKVAFNKWIGRMSYQLKQIGGIPYFVKDGKVYTFELEDGRPSKQCIAIGSYNEAANSITYDDGWFERIQPNLIKYRSGITVVERAVFRESVAKYQKPSKSTGNKPKSARAKSVKSK